MPESSGTVLISTHDLEVAGPLREAFQEAGYHVDLVTPGEDLSGGAQGPRLLILTGGLKNESAAALARQARSLENVPVFGIAREGEAGLRQAARALDLREVFLHPPDPREVLLLGRSLMERARLREITGIVGETDPILEALERVVQFAPVNATVLVTGESGTGKELIARGIHALSSRRHKAFIAVNVAALSDTLLESRVLRPREGCVHRCHRFPPGTLRARAGGNHLPGRDRGDASVHTDEAPQGPRGTGVLPRRRREAHPGGCPGDRGNEPGATADCRKSGNSGGTSTFV